MNGWHIVIMLLSIIVMEPIVALIHRYVMHGFGWRWHQDHHEIPEQGQKKRWLEMNDLYAIVFAAIAFALFLIAGGPGNGLWWAGLGITLYGALYAVVHDGLVHRRWPFNVKIKNKYLRRLVTAHHLHHAVKEREGAVSFGFLYAFPVEKLRRRLKELQHHD